MECLPKVAESLRAEGLLRWNGPMPQHRQATTGGLEHAAPLEGIEGPFATPSLHSALRLAV